MYLSPSTLSSFHAFRRLPLAAGGLTLLGALMFVSACNGLGSSADAGHPTHPAVQRYPLSGRVMNIYPERSSLLIAHEAVAGFMPAMTMEYKVDAAALQAATPSAHITGELVLDGVELHLENVHFTVPHPL